VEPRSHNPSLTAVYHVALAQDLSALSLATVKMFHDDASKAGRTL
jgi:hypothetical protein